MSDWGYVYLDQAESDRIMSLQGKCEICGELKPIGSTAYGIVCVSCLRRGYTKPISIKIPILTENTMSTPTAEQIQQLMAQNQALMIRVNQLEETEAQRTASVKISKNQNLTLSWVKHGGQTGAGSRGSWLIPSKERDGRQYIRCGGVPARLDLVGNEIVITSILPVDAKEAKTFTEKFTNAIEVRVAPPAPRQDGGQAPIVSASVPYQAPLISQPVPTTPTVDVSTILAEAERLMPTGLFKTQVEAVNAVKAKYGIK